VISSVIFACAMLLFVWLSDFARDSERPRIENITFALANLCMTGMVYSIGWPATMWGYDLTERKRQRKRERGY